MLERQAVQRQRDADTAHEGRVVLADEDHGRGLQAGLAVRIQPGEQAPLDNQQHPVIRHISADLHLKVLTAHGSF